MTAPALDVPNLGILADSMWAFGRSRALHAAVSLRLFDTLAEGPRTAAEAAKAGRAKERGVRILFDALVGMELLTKARDKYALNATSSTFLVSTSPAYVGEMVLHIDMLTQSWQSLAETVRTGRPGLSVDAEAAGREFFPKLVAALFPMSFGGGRMAREALPARTRSRVKRVLDVAAGSAAWSLAWAVADPEVRVTALDYDEVFPVTRQFTDRFGVTDRYEFLAGNLRKTSFGKEQYDLVILGHICHSEGARHSARLIERSARALKPGGLLLIAEMAPNDKRTGPLNQLLFGLNMLVNTDAGDVFTLAEYREWMKAAGLSAVRKLDFGAGGPDIIVGEKK